MSSTSSSTFLSRPDVVIFFAQVVLLFIVVIGALINLTFFNENKDLWQMLLTSSLGYMLPNPHFKIGKARVDIGSEENKSGESHELVFRDTTVKRPNESRH